MAQKKVATKTIPFQGGVITDQEVSLIPSGGYSAIQNMRMRHPGFEKRTGCRKLHTTADSTNEVVSLFQFSKGKTTERHFYAQMGDGDVLEATANPPSVTTGAFGSEVFSGSSGQVPAAWSVLDDKLVYSNGVDQHQIYPGTDPYVKQVVLVDTTSALTAIPDVGTDYTEQATDGLAATTIPLDNFLVSGTTAAVFTDDVDTLSTTGTAVFTDDVDTLSTTPTAIFTDTCENTTNWIAKELAELTVEAGGQSGNCIMVTGGAMYHDATTVVGKTYTFDFYFKKGTVYARIDIGTTSDDDSIYDTYSLNDDIWGAHSLLFIATETTTRITFKNANSSSPTNFLVDTINLSVYDDTDWSPVISAIIPVSGGQTTNGLQLTNTTAAAGYAYHDVTTITGCAYTLDYYFKKGTSASGHVLIGITTDTDSLYDSGALSDADWTAHTKTFIATATTTRITLKNTSTTLLQTSLFDTIILRVWDETDWTVSNSAIIPLTGGQATNCLDLTNTTAAAGYAYHNVTTITGCAYTLDYYFKKGTSASGHVLIGITTDTDSLYDSGALSDADWTAHTKTFIATATTTRITLKNTSATSQETSLFDGIVLNRVYYDYVYIKTDIPATSLKFTVSLPNSSAAVALLEYWNGSTFYTTAMTDGTIASAGKTLGQTGSMSWTQPADEQPSYFFDSSGFWYRLSLSSGALDSEVEVSAIQYNTTWQSIKNVWNGVPTTPVEISFYDQSATTYRIYAYDAITLGATTSSDIVYINSSDPICGFYIDMGVTPNTTASTAINAVNYFNGTNMVSVGTVYDGTDGLSKSGWVTFPRQTDVKQRQFDDAKYFSYWYSFTVDKTLSATITAAITLMPYFAIGDLGSVGTYNCSWQDRMLYVFDRFPTDIIVSYKHQPLVLNGEDSTFLERPSDGRANKIICMKRIYNNLLVWQEEKGSSGGTITLYSGDSPTTFAKKTISTHYGTFSAKSATVVEGIRMNINLDSDPPVSVAFFLSHYGVFMCDEDTIKCISNQQNSSIQNYFDPTKSECIRSGYESKMWLAYDPVYHCIRIGLVSGSSATLPNIFPVYDIRDKAWSFDSLAQEFSCLIDCEAASGSVTSVQCAGGIDDGQVYQTNYGTDDISTAIDAYATMEVDADGKYFNLDELTLRMKVQSAGSCTVTPYLNGIAQTAKTLSMTAEVANQVSRRHVVSTNLVSDHVSLKFQNATAAQSIYLKDVGVEILEFENQ